MGLGWVWSGVRAIFIRCGPPSFLFVSPSDWTPNPFESRRMSPDMGSEETQSQRLCSFNRQHSLALRETLSHPSNPPLTKLTRPEKCEALEVWQTGAMRNAGMHKTRIRTRSASILRPCRTTVLSTLTVPCDPYPCAGNPVCMSECEPCMGRLLHAPPPPACRRLVSSPSASAPVCRTRVRRVLVWVWTRLPHAFPGVPPSCALD